ncbi:MAG: CIA30 family protein [Bacteroidota bacterium]
MPPPSATPDSSRVLFDFGPNGSRWSVVNDGVMGGRSQGYVDVEDGTLRFTGTIVTQGGGFTSVRTRLLANLSAYDGVELRVRGGGRTFEVEVDDGSRFRGRPLSRRAPFPTTDDWQVVRVPFSELATSVFGQPVRAEALDPSRVRSVGLYILDGQDGPFEMEVDWIQAYREDE